MKLSAKILMLIAVFLYTAIIETSYAGGHKKKTKERVPDSNYSYFYALEEKKFDDGVKLVTIKNLPEGHCTDNRSDIRVYLAPKPENSYMEVDSPNDHKFKKGEKMVSATAQAAGYFCGEKFEGVCCKSDRHHQFDYIRYDSDALQAFFRNLWNFNRSKNGSLYDFVISFNGKGGSGNSINGIVVYINKTPNKNDSHRFLSILRKKLDP